MSVARLDDGTLGVLGSQGSVALRSLLTAALAGHVGDHVLVEVRVVVAASPVSATAVLAFIDRGEVASVLAQDFSDLHDSHSARSWRKS